MSHSIDISRRKLKIKTVKEFRYRVGLFGGYVYPFLVTLFTFIMDSILGDCAPGKPYVGYEVCFISGITYNRTCAL